MVVIRLLSIALFLLFCVSPLAAQSPVTQQNIIKPLPKQERATTGGSPAQTGQHEKSPNNHQSNTSQPLPIIEQPKTKVVDDTPKDKYNYEAANLKVQRELSKSTKRIAYFTIALVFVGVIEVIVFLVQVLLLQGTLKATEKAANAAVVASKAAQDQTMHNAQTMMATQQTAQAATESAMVARDTLRHTQRAFVFLKDIDFRQTRKSDNYRNIQWEFYPRWENSGDTATRNLIISLACDVRSEALPDDFSYTYINTEISPNDKIPYISPQKDIQMMIGPKANVLCSPLVLDADIAYTNFIRNEILFIYMWGKAEYNDIFKSTPGHITRFCVKLVFVNQPGTNVPLVFFNYYGKYNCADEDCSEQS